MDYIRSSFPEPHLRSQGSRTKGGRTHNTPPFLVIWCILSLQTRFGFNSWLYRILPCVVHKPYESLNSDGIVGDFSGEHLTPQQMRWMPMPFPESSKRVSFIEGWRTIAGAGEPCLKAGVAIHLYSANISMEDTCFYNSDGDLLIGKRLPPLSLSLTMGTFLNLMPPSSATWHSQNSHRVWKNCRSTPWNMRDPGSKCWRLYVKVCFKPIKMHE